MLIRTFMIFDYRIKLVRRTLPRLGSFAFEYRLPSAFPLGSSSSNPPKPYVRRNASSLNQEPAYNVELENDLSSILQFPVEIEDIGGTLVVELGINNAKVTISKLVHIPLVFEYLGKTS